jgi:Arc/MetJ family transcription regulator
MHAEAILVCMRTTLNLDDDLLARARAASGVSEKTALIHLGLRRVIAEAARERLANLRGAIPSARAPRRRRARTARG